MKAKKGITMAEPNLNEHISATRKNYLSDDNKGRMVEKSFLEKQGKFLMKIRDNSFNVTIRENAVEHIENFLKVVGPLKIKGTFEEHEQELNNNMTGDLEEPWSDNGVPYQLCDHICKPYHFKNGNAKWPTCSKDIYGFCNSGELPGMARVGCMNYFQNHKWYNELADGVLKEEALIPKARFEESCGDATPGVMKFYAWLKSSFENFHKLDYDEHKMEHEGDEPTLSSKSTHDPSVYQVRSFKMIKYSFDDDDDNVAIKEHECFENSRTNIDACQAYRELFRIMDEGWLMTKAKEE
nr:hypothetical protein [Tanacetum cinerariifolium]